MTARRPKVPRAVRPSPPAGERTGAGPTGHPPARTAPGHPKAASPSARKAAPDQSASRVDQQAASPKSDGSAPPSGSGVPRSDGSVPPSGPGVSKSDRSVSSSEARAAERTQLAGAIRRSPSGSTKRPNRVIEPAEDAKPIPAKSFSGRLLALGVVLVAVTVLLAPSLNTYLQQQAELDALREDIARQEQVQADHQTELARWDDPAYIKQQARDRIFLVMPGETRYLVKGGQGIEDPTSAGSDAQPEDLPWVDSLWSTISRAATD
ncbi:septum formation initiator family protein [Arthrobacter sp. Br18]|uniref:septum formation initiator family protein n=1 Tax=Arthrobacter sp. Br18 TaxID=1312954 RepID=UPI00047E1CD3|nr:septum formation initiator family protein [Arthrobacter sp. Br18]